MLGRKDNAPWGEQYPFANRYAKEIGDHSNFKPSSKSARCRMVGHQNRTFDAQEGARCQLLDSLVVAPIAFHLAHLARNPETVCVPMSRLSLIKEG